MIKICLPIPSYSTAEDLHRTLDSLSGYFILQNNSELCILSENSSCFDESIPDARLFANDDRPTPEELIAEWSEEDILIPLFAGDAISGVTNE